MSLFILRDEILKKHSKEQCDMIVAWVGSDQKRFDELFELFLNDDAIVVQRSGWPMSYCVEAYPELIKKHFARLIKNLKKEKLHDAVKRNSTRALKYVDIPEKYQGEIMDICFNYVASPTESVGVKVFSLDILGKLAKDYPEILPEIKLLIEEQWPHQTPGFKSSAKRIMKL
ncbi:MAG: hypothetical protein V4556_09175 [Bacteroidota bacterium]